MINTNFEQIENVLTRGVEKIYPSREALERVLLSGKKLRIYNGIDPTGKLHIGHLVILKKLRRFQDLGHEIIILIGDFTATIGDPTGKGTARKPLIRSQVLKNAKNYKKQIGKILDIKKSSVRFLYNEKWSNKLKPADLLEIFSYFTVARLLERDMFQERIKEGRDVLLHEFVYPVFQAYDSVIMDVDLEIGGNDQMFNMMRGRDLMKKMKNKEKFVIALKLLTDPTGKKMGKTEGNFVALDDSPKEIFGKIMSWPDKMVPLGFELLTNLPSPEINPREAKIKLAKEIITICHNQKAADLAEKEFSNVFKEGGLPSKIPGSAIKEKTLSILDLLVRTKLAASKSEAKRLILQKGVKIDGQIQDDWQKIIGIKKGQVLQIGKRKFAKIA
ncbi:MAG: tyrosine--tRNA ligase [Candidatus Nealsonbacteria bacterium RIFCSPLOWO2_01_FULL_41_9]|uniref:Tyrosine--tRNA ligase n=1 Tax=Candidatus Nealsonbacteria bacterium RIFCSPLOWO2_01_FULL_41_9 TaxID=1801671 RepID=A0A1G2EC92_9BACT|nr:MAG: tyrosine--tRNA ligase [Candidatus Nealsonbacteria bacterium RIFCSPLOWO2_01_FULL_41_9]